MTAKQPSWEAIERAYRAGLLSVRAIGESHGVNHATILTKLLDTCADQVDAQIKRSQSK
ncbi:hypothetical protein PS639_03756 [Pseudomonas fluorescens]|nr:hypothetical protein PS639_03756 [Pseudomonas fluorescens]